CKDCGQESAYRARGSDRRLGLRGSGCETHAKSQPQLGGSTTVARRVPTTRRLPATATDAGLLSNRATHLGSLCYFALGPPPSSPINSSMKESEPLTLDGQKRKGRSWPSVR
ncbi:hypothetical protein COCCADRAFT_105131, partial [Bipolaris zeicola 26-R-13]